MISRSAAAAILAWAALALPPARAWLESSMVLHMLVQLPLLAAIGFCLGRWWLAAPGAAGRARERLQRYNAGGATGIIAASFVMVLWMLPRLLDSARLDPAVDALKFLSVAAAGIAVALSWPRVPAIARAVVHLEVIATLLRFGWGYLAAEERLCLVYLAGDQRVTGELLLCAGTLYAILIVWRPLFGPSRRGRLDDAAKV
ncbi:MAG: hypothetical protein IT529_15615 [Burkholderiales bacterium]|nr:hypothetical protein [Burkholderiales bacterium]